MKKLIFTIFFSSLAFASTLKAEGMGLHFGVGLPYASQYGFDHTLSDTWSYSIGYNSISASFDTASVALTLPEVVFKYHPFKGSFFLGAGLGQSSLEVTAFDTASSTTVAGAVDSLAVVVDLGWMWGKGDGGLWFGMDLSYVLPMSADPSIDAGSALTSSTAYQDVESQLQTFGETAYINITFFRLGYLF
ncbi:MAG: hypothetical protein AB8E15_05805 [Bdellovibrionales bacterium]